MKAIYTSKKEAQLVTTKMRGWKIKIVADDNGNYCVQCNGKKYLRVDGYVR